MKTKKVFVLTDDARVVDEMQDLRPQWRIVTLADVNSKSYGFDDHYTEKKFTYEQRFDLGRAMIADIEVARYCDFFIGTYTSNVAGLVQALRVQPLNTCVDVEGYNIMPPLQ